MKSETRLERFPSISSCFPERFSGISFDESSHNFTINYPSAILHPLPSVPHPKVPVDKHLMVEQPGVANTPSKNSAPAFSSLLPQQHASTSIVSAQDDKISGSPLPTLPLTVHNFLIDRPVPPNMPPKNSGQPFSTLPSQQLARTNFRDHINGSAPAPTTQDEKISSSYLPTPLLPVPSFLRNRSEDWLTLYAPLYQSAMKGDWEMAKEFLRSHPGAINVRITKAMDTVLHIAAGAKRTKFVQEVVKLMNVTDLALRNSSGNTALCFAAASGLTEIAKVMVNKNKSLPGIRGNKGVTPLYVAALLGHREMVCYLNDVTRNEDLTQEDLIGLLIATIKTDLFDVALRIIRNHPELADIRDSNGETVLHVLARKPSAFSSKSWLGFWQTFIYQWIYVEPLVKSICPSTYGNHTFKINQVFLCLIGKLLLTLRLIVPGIKAVYDKKRLHAEALALLKLVWEQILQLDGRKLTDLFKSPSDPLFIAAGFGITEFVTEIICSYPDLIWKVDKHSRSIFHIAVMHRQEKIFNLIHDIGSHKDMITSYKDMNNQNILHLAANLAPSDQLNIISGAALQMQRELLWFKEVEKNVQPLAKEVRDKIGRTPRMLFSEEHKGLVKEGEKWMKSTASSCMLVATLITTVMFAAIFTVPGGNDNDKGTPIFLGSKSFIIFAISDAFALFSSVTSILMFLSILTSRYAEEDFLESLPKRLILGLATLFCSIASMLVAFSATFFIVLGQRLAWIAVPIALVSTVPMTLFAFLHFDLLSDMICTSYGSGIFARRNADLLY